MNQSKPKRGRPTKSETGERRLPFNISITESAKRHLETLARGKGLSRSECIEWLIMNA